MGREAVDLFGMTLLSQQNREKKENFRSTHSMKSREMMTL